MAQGGTEGNSSSHGGVSFAHARMHICGVGAAGLGRVQATRALMREGWIPYPQLQAVEGGAKMGTRDLAGDVCVSLGFGLLADRKEDVLWRYGEVHEEIAFLITAEGLKGDQRGTSKGSRAPGPFALYVTSCAPFWTRNACWWRASGSH